MKAAVLKELGRIVVEDIDTPVPQKDQVRIAVKYAALCGSDSSVFTGKIQTELPVVLGHEAIGIVESVGAEVENVYIGQRVAIHPNFFCGHCDLCQKGMTNLCRNKVRLGIDTHGVFAEYVVVPAQAVCPVPDDLPDEVAIFAEPFAVTAHAFNLAQVKMQSRTLIFGAGVMGQLTLQLVEHNCDNITICDLMEPRLELASRLGARRTVSSQDELQTLYGQFDVVFETSGAVAALDQSINLAAPGGTIVLLGIPGKDHSVPTVQIVRKELTIRGSMIYTDEIPHCLEYLSQGRINSEPLISDRIGLDQLQDALENFGAPQRMKVLVRVAD